jgi:hypothetical protein
MLAGCMSDIVTRKIALRVLTGTAVAGAVLVLAMALLSVSLAAQKLIEELERPLATASSDNRGPQSSSVELKPDRRGDIRYPGAQTADADPGSSFLYAFNALKPRPGAGPRAEQELGKISGTVLHRSYSSPLPYISLRLLSLDRSASLAARADKRGRFTFADIPPGRYNLDAESPNFVFQPKPIEVEADSVSVVRFYAQPERMQVKIPAYSEFLWPSEVPRVEVKVFRFSKVAYRLYKLDLAELFVNLASLDELLRADTTTLRSMLTMIKEYTYNVPYSEATDVLHLELPKPGLYLLEAATEDSSFRGLISFTRIKVNAVRSSNTLQASVLPTDGGLAKSPALVKALRNGRLAAEEIVDSKGMFSIDVTGTADMELLVSDGESFVYVKSETEPAGGAGS